MQGTQLCPLGIQFFSFTHPSLFMKGKTFLLSFLSLLPAKILGLWRPSFCNTSSPSVQDDSISRCVTFKKLVLLWILSGSFRLVESYTHKSLWDKPFLEWIFEGHSSLLRAFVWHHLWSSWGLNKRLYSRLPKVCF